MKTKKALAVLLAVVMLVMPFAVSSFAATANAIISGPIKTAYTDAENFNPIGIVISYEDDVITYTPGNTAFRFEPALNELLDVETTEVAVYYNNKFIATTTVTVEHVLGELIAIDNGHGKYCLGCGTLHEFEHHTVTNWIPNDDGGIFTLQTQTGVCDICNAEVTETIPGTSKFESLFPMDEESMTETELLIVDYLNKILVTLIQMLVGVK